MARSELPQQNYSSCVGHGAPRPVAELPGAIHLNFPPGNAQNVPVLPSRHFKSRITHKGGCNGERFKTTTQKPTAPSQPEEIAQVKQSTRLGGSCPDWHAEHWWKTNTPWMSAWSFLSAQHFEEKWHLPIVGGSRFHAETSTLRVTVGLIKLIMTLAYANTFLICRKSEYANFSTVCQISTPAPCMSHGVPGLSSTANKTQKWGIRFTWNNWWTKRNALIFWLSWWFSWPCVQSCVQHALHPQTKRNKLGKAAEPNTWQWTPQKWKQLFSRQTHSPSWSSRFVTRLNVLWFYNWESSDAFPQPGSGIHVPHHKSFPIPCHSLPCFLWRSIKK